MPYNQGQLWEVRLRKTVEKQTRRLPARVVHLLEALLLDLTKLGPIQREWPNFSKLSHRVFHCHLNYDFVVVWEVLDPKIKILEVRYVGSRESAPY